MLTYLFTLAALTKEKRDLQLPGLPRHHMIDARLGRLLIDADVPTDHGKGSYARQRKVLSKRAEEQRIRKG